jgi:DNA-dependent protein kinase catalytic subunit
VVKGGEDIRLDERIQQLWRVLCGLAARHPAAASRGLDKALATFDVLPLTPQLGMMQFVKVGLPWAYGMYCKNVGLLCKRPDTGEMRK